MMVSVTDFPGKVGLANQFTTDAGENNLVIDIANQSAGVYFLTVTGNESTVVSKFVKDIPIDKPRCSFKLLRGFL
ncbi:MAG: T9SS type A sorting domain-containing protein [Bacteroidota bacterium]